MEALKTVSVVPLRTSTLSPTLRLDLSISVFNWKVEPLAESTINLELVLYTQLLANICLSVLSDEGFKIFSPTLFTKILWPSTAKEMSPVDSKVDSTPLIRTSTFLVVSPSSYPKKFSLTLTSSFVEILDTIPEQPKNWLTVFDVYVTVFVPEIIVPDSGKPIVVSTEITEEPATAAWVAFVFAWIANVPSMRSLSSEPTNKASL